MASVGLKDGPHGARLVKSTRRYFADIRDGFNSGLSARTTRWHLPRSVHDIAHGFLGPRRYAIVLGDRVIGTCGLSHPQFSGLELVIAIFDDRARGLGIGTFAVRTLCDVAFSDLGTHRVELGVYPDNAAAIHVYRKCGFKREALLRRYMFHEGRWHDALWMSILRKDWDRLRKRAPG
jgi:RimJ/RimL family protein N-acetyltransferase